MMDLTELRRQHDDISLTAKQLTQATANVAHPAQVGAIRWQLARQLMAHLALEDRILYPALQKSGDTQVRDTAARLQTETGALADAFATYMSAWSDDRVARDWSGFCSETARILTALTDRIDRENKRLYPLADGARSTGEPIRRVG
jgi:iron-sulfur cluster repair protein YtfE (RIC family)